MSHTEIIQETLTATTGMDTQCLGTDFGLKKSTDDISLALASSVSQAEKTVLVVPGMPVALEGSQAQNCGEPDSASVRRAVTTAPEP